MDAKNQSDAIQLFDFQQELKSCRTLKEGLSLLRETMAKFDFVYMCYGYCGYKTRNTMSKDTWLWTTYPKVVDSAYMERCALDYDLSVVHVVGPHEIVNGYRIYDDPIFYWEMINRAATLGIINEKHREIINLTNEHRGANGCTVAIKTRFPSYAGFGLATAPYISSDHLRWIMRQWGALITDMLQAFHEFTIAFEVAGRGQVLTDAERAVVRLLAQDYKPNRIALQLQIEPDAVYKRIDTARRRLAVKTNAALVLKADRQRQI
jgi:DNA-binding CsgD family transcriptional regulator